LKKSLQFDKYFSIQNVPLYQLNCVPPS